MGFINSHYKFIIRISQPRPTQAKLKTFFYEILQKYLGSWYEVLRFNFQS